MFDTIAAPVVFRQGDEEPTGVIASGDQMPLFWSKVDQSGGPDACWTWTLGRDKDGYGLTKVNRKTTRAHRVAWALANGPIPDGLWVLHECDNPPCCNPRHLWLGTVVDNGADKAAKGRTVAPCGERHGSRTHPERVLRGSSQPCSKLTEADIPLIRAALARGESRSVIGSRFGVSRGAIGSIAIGKNWRHVSEHQD
jgi:hypothetical protein